MFAWHVCIALLLAVPVAFRFVLPIGACTRDTSNTGACECCEPACSAVPASALSALWLCSALLVSAIHYNKIHIHMAFRISCFVREKKVDVGRRANMKAARRRVRVYVRGWRSGCGVWRARRVSAPAKVVDRRLKTKERKKDKKSCAGPPVASC